MDFWPSSSASVGDRTLSTRRRKRKGKDREDGWDVPMLDAGALTAGTLTRDGDGHYDWIFAQSNQVGRRLVARRALQVTPPTRPVLPTSNVLNTTQRAEREAHFLRTHFPEIDIPTELLREELAENSSKQRSLAEYDPFEGELIEPVLYWEGARKLSAMAVHATGDLNNHLSFTPLIWDTNRTARTADPTSFWTSATPIQQVVAHKPSNDNSANGAIVAVRTMGSVQLLQLQIKAPPQVQALAVQAIPLENVLFADLDGKPVMDMVVSQVNRPTCFMVNSAGAVYEHSIDDGPPLNKVWTPSDAHMQDDPFWQLKIPLNEEGGLVTSKRTLLHFDYRSSNSSSIVYQNDSPTHSITSMDLNSEQGLICLSTTDAILWLDRRFPSRPVLGSKHHRGNDRSLKARWVSIGEEDFVYVTSKHNGLVMLYDTSHSPGEPLGLTTPPYSLAPVFRPNASIIHFQHPLSRNHRAVSFYELSGDGGIRCIETELLQTSVKELFLPPSTASSKIWDTLDDLGRLTQRLNPSEISVLGQQKYAEMNMRPVYEALLMNNEVPSEGSSEGVYDLLENMSNFWQMLDTPIDHVLTTFDVAFQAGDEPSQASRADFLTSTLLSSVRGFRALTQSRIPRNRLFNQAPWSYSLAPFLTRSVLDYSSDPRVMFDTLRNFNLADETSVIASQAEVMARQELVLDLALAADVYSPIPFTDHSKLTNSMSDDDALETMSLATGAMSLNDAEIPPVRYAYLRPVPQDVSGHYPNVSQERTTQVDSPPKDTQEALGVRSLLQDWTIGDNPNEYRYQEPHNTSIREARSMLLRARQLHAQTNQSIVPKPPAIAIVRAPPTIVPASQPPPASTQVQKSHVTGRTLASQKSEATLVPSQDLLPNTQVLPGPFGGRQAIVKKKPVKKRVGGF